MRGVEESLGAIGEKVRQVDETLSQIASATAEQSEGVSQINMAVGQMDKVTQGNAAGAEESASAATELSAQAESMNQAVNELMSLVRGEALTGFSKVHVARIQEWAPRNRTEAVSLKSLVRNVKPCIQKRGSEACAKAGHSKDF